MPKRIRAVLLTAVVMTVSPAAGAALPHASASPNLSWSIYRSKFQNGLVTAITNHDPNECVKVNISFSRRAGDLFPFGQARFPVYPGNTRVLVYPAGYRSERVSVGDCRERGYGLADLKASFRAGYRRGPAAPQPQPHAADCFVLKVLQNETYKFVTGIPAHERKIYGRPYTACAFGKPLDVRGNVISKSAAAGLRVNQFAVLRSVARATRLRQGPILDSGQFQVVWEYADLPHGTVLYPVMSPQGKRGPYY